MTKPDLVIVVAFGMIIPQAALDIPKIGMVNVHYSLLPQYRGAAPFVESILNGDQATGVTISRIVLALDAGDIIAQKKVLLNGNETRDSLLKELTKVGAKLLISDLPKWISGKIKTQPQTGSPSFTKLIKKEDGHLNFATQTATQIERMSRAYLPWPGIYTFWNGKKLELSGISISNEKVGPGKVRFISDQLHIGTKEGSISPRCVKIEGKNQCELTAFLRGYPDFRNAKFD